MNTRKGLEAKDHLECFDVKSYRNMRTSNYFPVLILIVAILSISSIISYQQDAYASHEHFKIQRGYTIIGTSSATATITAGTDYTAPPGKLLFA